ncbi:MAG: hypothetical protein ACPG5T_06265 [Endozoicomonas sp.]
MERKIGFLEESAWKNAQKNDSFEMEVDIKIIKEFDPDNKNLPSLQQAYLKAKNAAPKRKRSKTKCDEIMAGTLRAKPKGRVDFAWRLHRFVYRLVKTSKTLPPSFSSPHLEN